MYRDKTYEKLFKSWWLKSKDTKKKLKPILYTGRRKNNKEVTPPNEAMRSLFSIMMKYLNILIHLI